MEEIISFVTGSSPDNFPPNDFHFFLLDLQNVYNISYLLTYRWLVSFWLELYYLLGNISWLNRPLFVINTQE